MPETYTLFPLAYRVKKVSRYVRLYGPSRTIEKVLSQYHMRKQGRPLEVSWNNPKSEDSPSRNIGIIGCGNFSYSTIAYYCHRKRPGSIRATYDIVGSRAISVCKRYGGSYAAASADDVMNDPKISTIFVASNHASHAEFAIAAIEAGKIVHIEKPHVVSQEQLDRLLAAVERTGNERIFLGFNRPRSPHYKKIMESIAGQDGPMMINWFVAGHAIEEDHWYFAEREGGRILGNLCHWTDLSLRMVGMTRAAPITVVPGSTVGGKSDFALTFNFADGSVASITFSAKGHTFEGVREYLNVHRGDALISMRDFHQTAIDIGSKHSQFRTFYRDHGHKENISHSMEGSDFEPMHSVALSAKLFLAAKRAIDSNTVVVVE